MTAEGTLLKIEQEYFTNFHSIIDNESPTLQNILPLDLVTLDKDLSTASVEMKRF